MWQVKQGGERARETRRTVTYATHILRVGRIPQGPVVHLDFGTGILRLGDRVHEHVDRALGGGLCWAVEDGDAEHDAQALLAGALERLEGGGLAVELGLAVEVGRAGGGVGLVWGVPRLAGEDVVGRDVEEQDVPGGAEAREAAGGLDVEPARSLWVLVDLVREAICGACPQRIKNRIKTFMMTTGAFSQWTTTLGLFWGQCVSDGNVQMAM